MIYEIHEKTTLSLHNMDYGILSCTKTQNYDQSKETENNRPIEMPGSNVSLHLTPALLGLPGTLHYLRDTPATCRNVSDHFISGDISYC